MKRFFALFLLLAFLLCGCSAAGQRIKDPVTFYYILAEYRYGENAAVFDSEEREASGHRQDLNYLMALYLIGPSNEGLRSPFPRETRIQSIAQEGSTIFLTLTDTQNMTDGEFTRGCACLTLTCLGLTDAQTVIIQSGTRSVTMSRDTLILFDQVPTETEESK